MRWNKLLAGWLVAAFVLVLGAASCGDDGGEGASGPRFRTPSAIPSVALDCGAAECIR